MKRLFLLVTLLVLVSAAASAAHGQRSTVKQVAAEREHAAVREARTLVRAFVPPAGARRIWKWTGDTGGWPVGKVVDRHRFWEVPKAVDVAAFVGASRVRGVKGRLGENGPHAFSWEFSWPASGASRRLLTVTALPRRYRTMLRVDAKVVWIYPRSPTEKIPAGVRQIAVRAPKIRLKVTDGAKVERIVRWFDALPVSPPGVSALCGPVLGEDVTLSFRSAGGRTLAHAELPPVPASICDSISFAIEGHPQMPLIDNYYSYRASFLGRFQRLLGVRLLTPRR